MTDPTRPGGDTADSDVADSEVAPDANAEDCDHCAGADLIYPWICMGHTSAYQRGMQIAAGRDVPPLPVPALPTGVDDLDSDTYDALRGRYAWLEARYRDTVGSELAAVNARQAVEIGELRNSIAYKIRAELVCCHHDHGGQCYDGTEQTCHPGCHGAEMAARLAENEVHECGNDTYFDRTVCPEPCGAMHYRCRYCGFVADACPFETSDDTPEQP